MLPALTCGWAGMTSVVAHQKLRDYHQSDFALVSLPEILYVKIRAMPGLGVISF